MYAWCPTKRIRVVRRITHTLRSTSSAVLELVTAGGRIRGVTPSHPFWDVHSQGWRPAGLLSNAALLRIGEDGAPQQTTGAGSSAPGIGSTS